MWAPRLEHLGLQACYALDHIAFPDTHLLSAKLPDGFTATPFAVNTANACLSRRAAKALKANPRARPARSAHSAMPTESMFAGMHGMMGGMMGGLGIDDDDDDEDDDDDDDDDDEDEDENDEDNWETDDDDEA